METKEFDFIGLLAAVLRPFIQEEISSSIATAFKQLKQSEPADIIRIQKASEFLGIAKATIYSKVSRKELPYMKRGGRLFFSRKRLREWLETGR